MLGPNTHGLVKPCSMPVHFLLHQQMKIDKKCSVGLRRPRASAGAPLPDSCGRGCERNLLFTEHLFKTGELRGDSAGRNGGGKVQLSNFFIIRGWIYSILVIARACYPSPSTDCGNNYFPTRHILPMWVAVSSVWVEETNRQHACARRWRAWGGSNRGLSPVSTPFRNVPGAKHLAAAPADLRGPKCMLPLYHRGLFAYMQLGSYRFI